MSNDGTPGSVAPCDIASRGVGFAPVVDAAFGGASEVAMGAMAVERLPEREASGFQRRGCTTRSQRGLLRCFWEIHVLPERRESFTSRYFGHPKNCYLACKRKKLDFLAQFHLHPLPKLIYKNYRKFINSS